jgi:hypothetical protein
MPRDERNFENALARNLRANGSALVPANAPEPVPAAHTVNAGGCPDAEILAAYHERLLAPEEMIFRKEHIASCRRCQEILAQLEATDEIPLEADQDESVTPGPVVVPQRQLVPAGAIASLPVQAAVAESVSSSEVPRRGANWRWLVPAGALAAILLVWVAIHEKTTPQFQLAKNQPQPATGASPAGLPAPANPAKEKTAENDLQVPSAAENKPAAKTDDLVRNEQGVREQKAPPKVAVPRADLGPGDSVASLDRAQMQSRVQAQAPSLAKQSARAAAPAPSASPSPGVPESASHSVVNSVAVAPPAPPEAKKEAGDGGVAGAAVLQQTEATRAGVLKFRETAGLQATPKPVLVSSPDGAVMWRLALSGIVERSDDAGSNWTLQKTAVVTDLLAGSAPASLVCWIVGRTGTILRTTDAGVHWRKVTSPTTEDIASVFAVDAQQAIVTTATNKTFKTTDGGITWTPLPSP